MVEKVELDNPTQQGLKRRHRRKKRSHRPVELDNPTQQGLKLWDKYQPSVLLPSLNSTIQHNKD
jgi:hypothetical protein